MIRFSALLHFAVISLMLLLNGCVPAGDGQIDETRDPHYQRGQSLQESKDFKGAIVEFEKAIETNPRSAMAHFNLGVLCEQENKNYAEAIYHYQKHLALTPESRYADQARDQIRACTRELAKGEFSQPNTQNLQRDLDRLAAENIQLKQKIEMMNTQLVASASALKVAQETAATAESERATAVEALASARAAYSTRAALRSGYSSSVSQPQSFPRSTSRRGIHVIKSGETISTIAAQYGIRQNALLAANPKVNPRRLRPGQSLNLPTQ